jgi:predicted dehydrogenase
MWQITGSKGSLHLNMVAEQSPTAIYDSATPEGGTVSRELFTPEDEPLTGMAIQLDDFAHAIREQRRPRTGLEEALLVQTITDAIYESSRRGAAVTI